MYNEIELQAEIHFLNLFYEWLHFHFLLLCIGEGNGNPLQCSCLENPRDRGAWWASVYGVAAAAAKSLSRVQLCATIDGSPLGSSVPGILQARTLEWVAISFSTFEG